MHFIFKKKKAVKTPINSLFHVNDFVDFWHRDDVYFGVVSDVKLNEEQKVTYDIDIAGQCPITFTGILESQIIRIHKE